MGVRRLFPAYLDREGWMAAGGAREGLLEARPGGECDLRRGSTGSSAKCTCAADVGRGRGLEEEDWRPWSVELLETGEAP